MELMTKQSLFAGVAAVALLGYAGAVRGRYHPQQAEPGAGRWRLVGATPRSSCPRPRRPSPACRCPGQDERPSACRRSRPRVAEADPEERP